MQDELMQSGHVEELVNCCCLDSCHVLLIGAKLCV